MRTGTSCMVAGSADGDFAAANLGSVPYCPIPYAHPNPGLLVVIDDGQIVAEPRARGFVITTRSVSRRRETWPATRSKRADAYRRRRDRMLEQRFMMYRTRALGAPYGGLGRRDAATALCRAEAAALDEELIPASRQNRRHALPETY